MEKLLAMRLNGIADCLKAQQQDTAATALGFHERLAMLVDRQITGLRASLRNQDEAQMRV